MANVNQTLTGLVPLPSLTFVLVHNLEVVLLVWGQNCCSHHAEQTFSSTQTGRPNRRRASGQVEWTECRNRHHPQYHHDPHPLSARPHRNVCRRHLESVSDAWLDGENPHTLVKQRAWMN